MKQALAMANINLFAILRNLEDLCEMDAETRSIVKGKKMSIQFTVKGGPSAVFTVDDGKCALRRGNESCDIKLYFTSPEHLNAMFDGSKNPIPLKGLTKLDFLKGDFIHLTKRLEYFLKPTDELLADPAYLKINTYLTVYTAGFALEQIGNYDSKGILNASRIPDGVISLSISGGLPAVMLEAKKGVLTTSKGVAASARAYMTFSSLEVANAILNGKMASYSAVGSGDFVVKGFLPMLDNMNKLLAQIPEYVS
ncbi:MAG: hypothetical protein P4L75_08175 [Clostridia bacterium]|nr:hypothetical protein [Clostridia bacterium]